MSNSNTPPKSPKSSNKLNFAIALSYDGDAPPIVTATGQNDIAEEILKIAEEADVPIFEDHELATLLNDLELGEHIPKPLYRVIAEVLSFAYMLSGKHKSFMDKL